MVSSEVAAVLGTLGGTLLGSGIQYLNSRKNAEEASERLFEQRALDSKFERLEHLHDSLDDCRSEFRDMIVQLPSDMDEYSDRVRKPYDDFVDAADKARIYLSPAEREVVDDAIDVFNEARTHLSLRAQDADESHPDINPDSEYGKSREDLEEAAKPVFEIVRRKLDPKAETED